MSSFAILLSGYLEQRVGSSLMYPTYKAFCKVVGVDQDTLKRWRSGRTILATEHLLCALMDAIDLSLVDRETLSDRWRIEDEARTNQRERKLIASLSCLVI